MRVQTHGLSEVLLEQLRKEFTHSNPKFYQTKRMGLKWTREKKEIETWREGGGWMSVPLGGRDRVLEALDEHEVDYELQDRRVSAPHGVRLRAIEGRDYQVELVEVGIEQEVGVLRSAEGTGKTRAGLEFARRTGERTLIIVPATVVLNQWVEACEEHLGIQASTSERRGRGSPISVVMRQTLVSMMKRDRASFDEYVSTFGCVIWDEAQTAAAPTAQRLLDRLKARYRIGITADERRSDGKQSIIYDFLGPMVFEFKRSEAVERGIVLDAEIVVVPTAFEAPWYTELDEEKRALQNNRLYDEMVADPERCLLVERLALKAWGDDKHERPVVVMSLRRALCEWFRDQFPDATGLLLGGDKPELEACIAQIERGELAYVAATYQAVGVGFDAPQLRQAVFAMPVANATGGRRQWHQFVARFTRSDEGKTWTRVYYLWDRAVFGLKPLRNICKWQSRVRVRVGDELVDGAPYLREQSAIEAKAQEAG